MTEQETNPAAPQQPTPAPQKARWTKKTTLIAVIAAAVVVTAVWFFQSRQTAGKAYVFPVSTVASGTTGGTNRYIGTVEPQESKDVAFDTSKELGELAVAVGDEVAAGQKLFSYDTSSMNTELQQLQIDRESIKATIDNYQSQLEMTSDATERAILQRQIQDARYELQKKQVEIDAKDQEIRNTDVLSPIDGVIKAIVTPSEALSGGSTAQITIVAKGEYLIKAKVSEMNISALSVGQAMLVRSRADETKTWTGTITAIDTSGAVPDNNNGMFYYGANSSDTASQYYFYVALDDPTGLLMGQHVTVEATAGSTMEGLVLGSYYLNDIDTRPFVWKEQNGKLVRAYVTLGQHDEATDEYQILDGLTASDNIAYPSDAYREGMATTTEFTEDINNTTDHTDDTDDTQNTDHTDNPENMDEPVLQEETPEPAGDDAAEAAE
jgi:HlyD family secretion protein